MNKKLMLSLGTIAVVTTPIAAVSCGVSKSSIRKKFEGKYYDSLTADEKKDYILLKTKTETAAFSWNKKDHVTYQVWINKKTNEKRYKEI